MSFELQPVKKSNNNKKSTKKLRKKAQQCDTTAWLFSN